MSVALETNKPIAEDEEAALLSELNFQQETFAIEYVANGRVGSLAAEAAGYAHPEQTAYRMLRTPWIKAYIDFLLRRRAELTNAALQAQHFSRDKVLADLCEMAGFDLSEVLDDWGRVDRSKIKVHAKQLQSVEIDGPKTKIKGPDRMAAYRMLAELMGWTTAAKQVVAVRVNVDFGERMAFRRARALEDRDGS